MDNVEGGDDSTIYHDMESPEEMLQPEAINPFFSYIILTNSITFFIGVIGNLVAVTMMVADRERRNATNLFLVSLAVADLLLLLLCVPLNTLQYFLVQWNGVGAVCTATKFVEVLSAIASVLNLCAVSLERFIAIVFPTRSRSLCSIRNCRKSILMVWIVSIILSTPLIPAKSGYSMNYRNTARNITVTIFYCIEEDAEAGVSLVIYKVIVLLAAPGLLMFICYMYMIPQLWRSPRNMNPVTRRDKKNYQNSLKLLTVVESESQSAGSSCQTEEEMRIALHEEDEGDDEKKARKQVMMMLIVVIVLFLICWGPKLILSLTLKLETEYKFSQELYFAQLIFNLVPFVHSCINPLIYLFMWKNFRRSLQRSPTIMFFPWMQMC